MSPKDFISHEDYPKGLSTNCLAFALGLTEEVPQSSTKYNLDSRMDIAQSFLKYLSDLGFDTTLFRQVSTISEIKNDDFAFMVFDFTPYNVRHPFLGLVTYWDFHVVRREPDGKWYHKPGWKLDVCEVHSSDWEEIFKEFGKKYVLFTISPEKGS